jgi:hypothetical protein
MYKIEIKPFHFFNVKFANLLLMKTIILILFVVLGITTSFAQEESETSGDNFSLEGALEMFKKSSSLEEFEKLINSENNDINNLDLNEDGDVDYINVESIKEGDTHVIILSTYLNDTDIQDVATIGIEKTGNEEAILQIEGDENLYPVNTFVEPFDVENEVENSNNGPEISTINPKRVIVNVWFWPCVKFMYSPRYVVWKSPYRWKRYPNYWKPWKARTFIVFKSRCAKYKVHFHRTTTHRVVVAKKIYNPRRKVVVVKTKKYKKTKAVNPRGRTKTKRR